MGSLTGIGRFLVSMLARSLPRRVSYLIGETAGCACFLLRPARRRKLCSNLRVVTRPPDGRVPARLAMAVMVNFARSVVDTFLAPHMDNRYLARHVRITDRPGLASLAGRGREHGSPAIRCRTGRGAWSPAPAGHRRRRAPA